MKVIQLKVVTSILACMLLFAGTCSLTACNNLGNGALKGADINANGVRDDVEEYIAGAHKNSAVERAALMQLAGSLQKAIVDAESKERSILHAAEVNKAIECMEYTAGVPGGAIAMEGNFRSVFLNTDERNKAFATYSKQVAGFDIKFTPADQLASTCVAPT